MSNGELTASVADHASRGYRTTFLSQALRLLCKAGSVVILARWVPPSDHGLYAMASTVFLVLVLFRDCGLGVAAVQAPALSDAQQTTLWHAHLLLGAALALVTAALAPLVAGFYHEPSVTPLLRTMAVAFVLLGVNAWPRVWLVRELRFAELNRVETLAAIVGTVGMLAAAKLGAGPYAFAVFLLGSEAVSAFEAWRLCGWRARARTSWSELTGLLETGLHVTGYNVLLAITQQVDSLLMGRWFGPAPLGYYNRPNQMLALANQHLTAPYTQVLTATLARLQREPGEFRKQVGAATNAVAHLTLPLAALCAAMPAEIVRLVLGQAWPAAAPLLRWLAFAAATSYASATLYAVCVATAHTRRLAGISALALLTLLGALGLGRSHGATGLAAAVALANAAWFLPRIWWSTRGTPVGLRTILGALAGPARVSLALGLGGWAAVAVLAAYAWPLRLVGGLGGALLAAGAVIAFSGSIRDELSRTWRFRT